MRSILDNLIAKSQLVQKADKLARQIHQKERRETGEPYYFYPRAIAQTIATWNIGEQCVAAALLHEIPLRGTYSLETLREKFGDEVAFILEGILKMNQIRYSGLQRDLENLRKLILHLSQDIRVILLKLAKLLEDLKSLYVFTEEERRRIALETMEIYAPLAYRIGMYELAGQMEDLAFPYLYPQEYKWLIKNVRDLYEARQQYVEKLKPLIEERLKGNGVIPTEIHYRAKRYTSLYKKLLRYDMDMNKIYDLVALRVILKDVDDCYKALHIIHSLYPQTEGFDDYIANPKPNGYQSIHTNIKGPQGKIIEIQIRTATMHQEAELGLAGRLAYERWRERSGYITHAQAPKLDKSMQWVKKLILWKKDPHQNSRINIFEDTILVLSPTQEIIELPKNATPIDFAYKIHSRLGNRMKEVKINGVLAPLDTKLQFGDIVEIITDEKNKPDANWLNGATTQHAKDQIRAALEPERIIGAPHPIQKPLVLEITYVPEEGFLKKVQNILESIGAPPQNITLKNSGLIQKVPVAILEIPAKNNEEAKERIINALRQLPNISEITTR